MSGTSTSTATTTSNTDQTSTTSDNNDNNNDNASRVTVNIDANGIAHVEWNRPEKLNACDLSMFEAIAKTASDLRQDRSLRAVIMSGKGRAFCTGLDVKAIVNSMPPHGVGPNSIIKRLLERPSGYGSPDQRATGNLAQDVSMLWRELPVPVIAVLHGMCYGAGFQIALGADFRFSTLDCKLSIMEGKWGLIPDMGASVLLKELVRIDIAKELTMTAKIITGKEAATLGLVTRVCDDPMKEAMALAQELVQKSPDAIACAKELYQSTWNASEEDALKIETRLQEKLLLSWNQLATSGRSAFGVNVPYFNRKP